MTIISDLPYGQHDENVKKILSNNKIECKYIYTAKFNHNNTMHVGY